MNKNKPMQKLDKLEYATLLIVAMADGEALETVRQTLFILEFGGITAKEMAAYLESRK